MGALRLAVRAGIGSVGLVVGSVVLGVFSGGVAGASGVALTAIGLGESARTTCLTSAAKVCWMAGRALAGTPA
jgi:hypothetical protein